MAYAVQADYLRRITALRLTALTAGDTNVQIRALNKASSRIDSKLHAAPLAADVPLAVPYPEEVVEVCVDLAVYYLAQRLGAEERERQNYLDAEALLEEWRTGKSTLGIQAAPAANESAGATYATPDQMMTSTSLADF